MISIRCLIPNFLNVLKILDIYEIYFIELYYRRNYRVQNYMYKYFWRVKSRVVGPLSENKLSGSGFFIIA